MQKKMWLEFPNSVSSIVERNKSFDACTIHVMYTGKNRNRTSISREAAEKAIPTLYNCPIVCHYKVAEDKIGGHDVEFINTENGLKMVNLTDAVGVIPEGSQYRWETYEDASGTHDYLVVDGLLWKRSSAYDKLKRNEVSGQSMEITVNEGKSVDGYFEIYDFDFTAFCILGEDTEPCFESADIETYSTYSLSVYKQRFASLMDDLRDDYPKISPDENGEEKFSLKGGNGEVRINELMKKYGLTEEDITFSTDGMSEEDIESKFSEISNAKFAEGNEGTEGGGTEGGGTEGGGTEGGGTEGGGTEGGGTEGGGTEGGGTEGGGTEGGGTEGGGTEGGGTGSGEDEEDVNSDEEDDASDPAGKTKESKRKSKRNNFALTSQQLAGELSRELEKVTYYSEWCEANVFRYWYIDHDEANGIVYADDYKDNVICGFNFEVSGDKPVIKFESYKRKKCQFVDFEDGETVPANFARAFDAAKSAYEMKISRVNQELEELRKFHNDAIAAQRADMEKNVFDSFADLTGNESFEALKSNCSDMTIEELSEKCFAIRGRNMKVTFSAAQPTSVRLPVERDASANTQNDPYNGVFTKYGYNKNN